MPEGGREHYHRFQEGNQSALSGSVVWATLDNADKVFGQGVFDADSLLHNLREQDWKMPLSELRDMFWNAPRVPLLPGGEEDLSRALYEAITDGKVEIVDNAGAVRTVATAGDINLGINDLRIERPSNGQIVVPDVTGQGVEDARVTLKQAGLNVSGAIAPASGTVIQQDPAPATPVDPGTTITLRFGPASTPPKTSATEHQVSLSITTSLKDVDVRRAIWQVFNEIGDAIDGRSIPHPDARPDHCTYRQQKQDRNRRRNCQPQRRRHRPLSSDGRHPIPLLAGPLSPNQRKRRRVSRSPSRSCYPNA